jgi:hypothetical protein
MKLAINASGSLQNPAFRGDQLCFTRFHNRYNSGRSDIGIFDLKTGITDFLGFGGEANVSQPISPTRHRRPDKWIMSLIAS